MDTVNYTALLILVENNWAEFVGVCGSESEANKQFDELLRRAGRS